MSHRPPYARKRFGQHFLQDNTVLEKIVASAEIQDSDHVIEIGPGRGALTRRLLERGVPVTVIEIDRDLALQLGSVYGHDDNFRMITADILKIDWKDILDNRRTNKIIANLPYNISTPLFFKFVQWRTFLSSITVMVQKEVAQRLCHNGQGKKLKDYGVLSVIASTVFESDLLFKVPPACFTPRPKVDSAVIRLVPKEVSLCEEEHFFDFVRKSFNQRRKLLKSSLKKNMPELFEALPPDDKEYIENLRPENLLPSQYLRLFYEKKILT